MSFLENIKASLKITKKSLDYKMKDSKLGLIWYIIEPLIIFLAMLFVFQGRLGRNIIYYPLYLLMGLMLLRLFQNIVRESISLDRRKDLLDKNPKTNYDTMIRSIILKHLFLHL